MTVQLVGVQACIVLGHCVWQPLLIIPPYWGPRVNIECTVLQCSQ